VSGEHERIVEELAAYALESLEGPEQARIGAHVVTCAACTGLLKEYRAVLGALPLSLEPMAPPPEAWEEIRKAAGERRPPARPLPRRATITGSLQTVKWPAVAVLIASLLVWNVVLQREVARQSQGPQVEALARRPGQLIILAGAGAPAASARLLVAADGGHGHLAIAGLTPLPPERTYQLWFVRAGAPTVTGGTFNVDERGHAWVSVETPVPFDEVREIVVTNEAAPGSVAPMGNYLLVARSWR
jgi:anti-sigma-K factor RskA